MGWCTRGLSVGVALSLGTVVSAQTISQGNITARLGSFVTIPSADGPPQDLVSANDNSGRTFIATRNGRIDLVDSSGNLSGTPFLNIATSGVSLFTGGEGGFPGLAFSPTYATDGKFYTFTTETFTQSVIANFSHPELLPGGSATPANQIVIREWTRNAANANQANTTSRVLMRINHPQDNHQGGSLKFGPDGDLYIGLGDGGGGNDNLNGASNNSDGHTNSTGNAQDKSVVFGKILRIDPRGSNSTNGQYGVPTDNPFVSGGGLPEIYAYGVRNPYRFSFDSVSGKLYAGDVGQGNREEVDVIDNGGNYGWVFREGTRDNTSDSGRSLPNGFTSIAPIGEYSHGDGNAIQGGFVYHGSLIPALQGKYVFGDYQGNAGVGRIFYMDAAGGTISELKYDLTNGGLSPASINGQLFGFGEDQSGELYALFANGRVLKFVPEPSLAGWLLFTLLSGRRRRATRS